MKITMLSLIISAFLFVSIKANAQNILSNIDTLECGVKKEMTLMNESDSKPLLKKVYIYDLSGMRLSQTIYLWKDKSGWIEHQEYTYRYKNNRLVSIQLRGCNNSKTSDIQQNMVYVYDDMGILLTIKHIKEKNVVDNVIELKL